MSAFTFEPYIGAGTIGTATAPILDSLLSTTPLSAYGLRKLRGAYTGNCLKVRRSSDNTTKDIGFLADGSLDVATMMSFVGSNSGFVDTWYDQVGSNNVVQATLAQQPRIVNAGALDLTGDGNIAINIGWNFAALDATYVGGGVACGNNVLLQSATPASYTCSESYTVHCNNFAGPGLQDNVPAAEFIWCTNFNFVNQAVLLSDHQAVSPRGDAYGSDRFNTSPAEFLNNLQSSYGTRTAGTIFSMQFPYGPWTAQNRQIHAQTGCTGVTVGCSPCGSFGFGQQGYNGWILELIIFAGSNSLSTADQALLFANQRARFNIQTKRLSDSLPYVMFAGFSTRRLRTGYTGPCLTVRRDSDNATQDINFATNAEGLDTTALLAFVGSANGYVTKWYDQSAYANHLTQGTAAKQPQIVSAGSVITQNGGPILLFNTSTAGTVGMSCTLISSYNGSGSTPGFGSTFIVEKSTVTTWPGGSAASPVAYFQGAWNGSIVQGNIVTNTTWHNSFNNITLNNVAGASANETPAVTGNLETLQSLASPGAVGAAPTQWAVGCMPGVANTGHPGYIGEVVILDEGPLTNDITAIYNNQKAYWGTP